jgi:hypothetical protein
LDGTARARLASAEVHEENIVHWDGNAAPQSDALPAEFFERAD